MQMPEFMKTIIIKRINTIAFLKNTKPQLLYQQEVPEKQTTSKKITKVSKILTYQTG